MNYLTKWRLGMQSWIQTSFRSKCNRTSAGSRKHLRPWPSLHKPRDWLFISRMAFLFGTLNTISHCFNITCCECNLPDSINMTILHAAKKLFSRIHNGLHIFFSPINNGNCPLLCLSTWLTTFTLAALFTESRNVDVSPQVLQRVNVLQNIRLLRPVPDLPTKN